MAYIKVDADNRLTACSWGSWHLGADEIMVDLPGDFDPESLHDWRLDGGALVHDPLPVAEPAPGMDERILLLEQENAQLKEALDLLLSGVVEEAVDDG